MMFPFFTYESYLGGLEDRVHLSSLEYSVLVGPEYIHPLDRVDLMAKKDR